VVVLDKTQINYEEYTCRKEIFHFKVVPSETTQQREERIKILIEERKLLRRSNRGPKRNKKTCQDISPGKKAKILRKKSDYQRWVAKAKREGCKKWILKNQKLLKRVKQLRREAATWKWILERTCHSQKNEFKELLDWHIEKYGYAYFLFTQDERFKHLAKLNAKRIAVGMFLMHGLQCEIFSIRKFEKTAGYEHKSVKFVACVKRTKDLGYLQIVSKRLGRQTQYALTYEGKEMALHIEAFFKQYIDTPKSADFSRMDKWVRRNLYSNIA
jgi:hypothetical protein